MEPQIKVLVADQLSDAGVAALSEHFTVDVRIGLPKDELIACIADYDAVVVRSATTIDADVIAAADKLKVIARAGIGLDNVDVGAATARGVLVCNAPQSNIISAAEHTVALLLSLARMVPAADRSLREGKWKRSDFEGVELHGKTLGVLGLGRIGTLVAQRCLAFGMKLVAYDPYISAERAARMGVELIDTVPELCKVADFVTVHLPKNAETVGIVGIDELRSMKPTARVINVARGGIIDEAALYTALTEGWIAGAALDVFSSEPMTDSPLFSLPNVVVTPHLGASTTEAQDKAGTMVAESVVLALQGEFVPSAVNVQVGAGIPEAVKPFMPLAETLGRLFTGLHAGAASDITVELVGKVAEESSEALVLSALKGLLVDVAAEPVTFVNAPLIAEERGITVSTLATRTTTDYLSLLRLSAGSVRVAGTVAGPRNKVRLVEVWGAELDLEPAPHMLFFRYVDKPGVVGQIGGHLGQVGANIAAMQVSRSAVGGDALMVLAIDSAVEDGVVDRIAAMIGASEARSLDLD